MTVSSTTNRKSFSGDGVTTSFGTSPVVFYESTDLVVAVYSSTGVATTLTEGTDYSVTGGSSTGAVGTVNLAGGSSPYGAPAVGTTLLIRRVLPLVQEADFVNNDINDAGVSETALDKLTMISQQISETSGRGVAIPAVETATPALTELPFDRASKFLAFDASKNMIASDGPAGDNVPVSTFMATVLDDADAATARGTLEAAGSGDVTGSGLTMATSRILGRDTGGTGAIEELTLTETLDLVGSAAQGDILYRNASAWTRLAAGNSGQFLQTLGSGQNPAWANTPSAGTAVTAAGTSMDFAIPSGATQVVMALYAVSLNGATGLYFRLGDSGGVVTSGYEGTNIQVWTSVSVATDTAYWRTYTASAAAVYSGDVVFTLIDPASYRWNCTGQFSNSNGQNVELFGGSVTLTSELTTIRTGSVDGTSTFDAGFFRRISWS